MALTTSPRYIAGHKDAQRSAESLFESQSVVQIREVYRTYPVCAVEPPCEPRLPCRVGQVETKARNDIEDKKHQLRQLVGGSYRYDCFLVEYLTCSVYL